MKDLIFLIPLALGLATMGLGVKFLLSLPLRRGRPFAALCLMLGSLLWWLSSAIVLLQQEKFYLILNILTCGIFFAGLALLLPPPPGATKPNEHRPAGNLLLFLGFAVGIAHTLALSFIPSWAEFLRQLYLDWGIQKLF